MEQDKFESLSPTGERKNVFFRVTPLSKYLALTLFITLPFVGGWIGYKNTPEKIVEMEKIIIKEVLVEKEIETPDFDNPDYIECFNSKDYFVVAPRFGSNLESIIIKDKKRYIERIPCEYEILDGDTEIERYSPSGVFDLANNRLYIDSGASKIRGLAIFDIELNETILKDTYIGVIDMETSADFVRYWSVADDEMEPEDCADFDWNWGVGLNEYVEYNFITKEETIIEKECAKRE